MTDADTIGLREYIEQRMEDCRACHDAQMEAMDKAIELAASQLGVRLDHMNEFRDTLKDQSSTFIPRPEFEKIMTSISENHNERLRALELSRAELQGKASQASLNVAMVVAVMSAIISIVGVVTRILRDIGPR